MTGKLSAAFGAGLLPELRSDSAPHQGGQARSGCSSEGISRQEDGRDVTNSRREGTGAEEGKGQERRKAATLTAVAKY